MKTGDSIFRRSVALMCGVRYAFVTGVISEPAATAPPFVTDPLAEPGFV
ncbi:MAG: hypothetical protein ACXQTZ_01555 [Candidatus Alkanophagales archaeon]